MLILRTTAFIRRSLPREGAFRCGVALLALAMLCGCAGLPPGADFPKTTSVALAHPEETGLGQQFSAAVHEHGDNSAFRVINVGVDGFRLRMQLIDAGRFESALRRQRRRTAD